MEVKIKPNKKAFCDFAFIKSGVVSLIFLLFAFLIIKTIPAKDPTEISVLNGIFYGIIGLLFVINAFQWYIIPVIYGKEEYILLDDRVIAKKGGLFSNFEQELLVKNITHIIFDLPFLAHKFYGTGGIKLQAAGGGNVEVNMRAVDNPHEVYEKIVNLLQTNGFSMAKGKLLYEDRPAGAGVILTTFITVVAVLFCFVMFVAPLIGGLAYAISQGSITALILAVFIGIFCLAGVVLIYKSISHQSYYLYEKMIISKSYFLTVTETIIPIENLSDSSTKQGFVGKILGIYNLTLSCQGSDQEIAFNYIKNGKKWEETLDSFIEEQKNEEEEKSEEVKEVSIKKAGSLPARTSVKDKEYKATLKMDRRRCILPGLSIFVITFIFVGLGVFLTASVSKDAGAALFIVAAISFVVGILSLIIRKIQIKSNTFYIKSKSFEKRFKFISSKNVEFQAQKITGIVITQDILDRFFKTCSIKFWSIGSNEHLIFSHIGKDEEVISKIKSKIGIYHKEEKHVILPEASFENIIKSGIFYFLFLTIAFISLIFTYIPAVIGVVFLAALPIIMAPIWAKFVKLELYDDYVCFSEGILFKRQYYVNYEDVKYIKSTLYPACVSGKLRFEVTGERVVKTKNGQHVISNHFSMNFVPVLYSTHIALDALLANEIKLSEISEIYYSHSSEDIENKSISKYVPEVVATSKPRFMQNMLGSLILLGIIDVFAIFMLAFFYFEEPKVFEVIKLPAFLILPILNVFIYSVASCYIKTITYMLDAQKVIRKSGIFYKEKMGIHFVDIDFIGQNQGAFNKIFKTGNVTVNTVGSSRTDLTLRNLSDYKKFYELLKKSYQK